MQANRISNTNFQRLIRAIEEPVRPIVGIANRSPAQRVPVNPSPIDGLAPGKYSPDTNAEARTRTVAIISAIASFYTEAALIRQLLAASGEHPPEAELLPPDFGEILATETAPTLSQRCEVAYALQVAMAYKETLSGRLAECLRRRHHCL